MVCSEVLDGVVCIECMCPLFLVSQKRGFVICPFVHGMQKKNEK